MTYTLVFRVTREVWDAVEKGKKRTEYRDCKPFWCARMNRALATLRMDREVEALFLGPPKTPGEPWRKARYAVTLIHRWDKHSVRPWEQKYLHTSEVWAVELGERIDSGEELARRMEGRGVKE